jgi:hypothetical protein
LKTALIDFLKFWQPVFEFYFLAKKFSKAKTGNENCT